MTKIKTDKRPRLQKLQNMYEIKETMKTANEALVDILEDKHRNLTKINHLICAAVVVVTKKKNKWNRKL
jgi:hypothetical protein